MKIIHTADLHLDSPLVGVADGKLRRAELLRTLSDIAQYAQNNGVSAVLVAGDLFDDKFVSQNTIDAVSRIIAQSSAQWFVLRGNHGDKTSYERLGKLCSKILFFDDAWTTYTLGNVAVTGRELGVNDAEQWAQLRLDKNFYNILVLHGDVDDPSYGLIDKNAIANAHPDYVALGHRHSFDSFRFGTVKACYCGVPEPRGFDENTETGFVLIDTESDKISFVRHQIRRVENRKLDVTSIATDWTLQQRILDTVADVLPQNYLNLKFVGALSAEIRLVEVAKDVLQNRFFALRIEDATKTDLDLDALQKELSLRGEFVKLALQLDESQRDDVLRLGLAALQGEI